MRIYLDYNSTTPCAAEVIASMLPYFDKEYGNPSSTHSAGRVASIAISEAREKVAQTVGVSSDCVIFTSGATESNNLALLGIAQTQNRRNKIIVSTIEHKSVLEPALQLVKQGYTLETIPIDSNGVIDVGRAQDLIDNNTLIVSVQGANNETGVLQPVREIARLAHKLGAFCHCDAVQMLGKCPIDLEDLEIDMASFSSHKVYGPKGIGALVWTNAQLRNSIKPLLYGGGQEHTLRPGTQNVPAIVGFGTACYISRETLTSEMERLFLLRQLFEKHLLNGIPGSKINGFGVSRLPGTISLTIPRVPADILIANLSTVCISNGAACHSGALEPSHVLLAMKLSRSEAECTVRISLGRYTTEAEVEMACQEIIAAVLDLRAKLCLQVN